MAKLAFEHQEVNELRHFDEMPEREGVEWGSARDQKVNRRRYRERWRTLALCI